MFHEIGGAKRSELPSVTLPGPGGLRLLNVDQLADCLKWSKIDQLGIEILDPKKR
jgi:hypothetical protein